jgi:NAD(P)-dependent dehydrogenase (short-subunit alcohol dehydrogenase family)
LEGRAQTHAFDCASEEEVAQFFGAGQRISHLIIALGGRAAPGHFRDLSEERLREAFEAKFWAHMRILRHAAPKVEHSITIVSGLAAVRAFPKLSGVAATNGAINAMIGPLAIDLAPVRVNAVAPGLIATPYWDSLPVVDREAMYASTAARIPTGRVGAAEDVAGAIFFLATNEFTTGAVLPCDGGARHT